MLFRVLTLGACFAAAADLPHLDDMISRVFAIDAKTEAAEADIDSWLSQQPPEQPRAAVVFLLKDLRCGGAVCQQNVKWGRCSYMDQAVRSVGSLTGKNSLLGKKKYPVLLYHADWRDADQAMLERASGLNAAGSSRAWWQRVTFDGSSLPPYLYDVNRTVGGWKDFHFGGDLSRATKANIHGYGYMLMCRFYAGLIHHAPLARRFDYYLRIDGDSRLSATTVDPFQFMQTRGAKYGSLGGNYAETAGAATALPHIFAKMRPELDLALAKWGARPDCPADAYTCPFTHPKAKQHKQCNLRCRLALPEKVGQVPLPVPICSDAVISKVPSCPSFYNNFEVVDMRAFRTPEQWDFFLLAERSHAFLCEQSAGRSHAGKCGGGGMGDALFRTLQVNTFLLPTEVAVLKQHVTYRHPVPIARFCGPRGVTDGGPAVQKVAA